MAAWAKNSTLQTTKISSTQKVKKRPIKRKDLE